MPIRTLAVAACALGLMAAAPPSASSLRLASADLADGAAMAPTFIYPRCGGGNVSPALAWSGAPAGAKSFALTMIDIDVKPDQWSHWIVTGLPPQTSSLPRGAALPAGARGVVSNFGDAAYDGPCPPPGTGRHHYRLTVWALPDTNFAVDPDTKAKALSERLAAAALAHAEITIFVDAPAR